jgi:hypothetical protein
MADAIEITKNFPASRERTVLLELLKIARTLKQENIEAVICGGWVPFLKELAQHSQTTHSMSLDIDVLLRAKAVRERPSIASRACFLNRWPSSPARQTHFVTKRRSRAT